MPPAPQRTSWKENIPHIIVLALLVVLLLVVVTKFKWVHCSQVPGWCDVYCSAMGNSRVAIITGQGAIGDSSLLVPLLQRTHPITLVEPFPADQMSAGLLEPYELVIVEGPKNFSLKQRYALEDYLDRGGSLLLVGDAITNQIVTADDLELARIINATKPYYYERIVNESKKVVKGFGELGSYYMATEYIRTEAPQPITLKRVARDSPIMAGLRDEFLIGSGSNATPRRVPYSVVTENPAAVTKIAVMRIGDREYPAILERKYAGRIIYFAFPPEQANSPTLIANLLDYLITC